MKPLRHLLVAAAVAAVSKPASILACSVCFNGKTDSAMAAGFNSGMIALLVVLFSVLGGIISFFVYLSRRSRSSGDKSGVSFPQRELANNG